MHLSGVFALWLVLVTLSWVTVIAQVRFEREEALTNAIGRASNLAIAFEQYAIRTLEGAEGIIRAVVREYMETGDTIELAPLVEALAVDRSSYEAIGIVDAGGFVATSALAPPLDRAINIADREHFLVHRDQELGQAVVGRPVLSRRSGHDVIPLTHRLNDGAGRFAGIVSVQFAPAAFTAFYRDATQGPRDVLSLVGRDGITRARRVGDRTSTGEDLSGAQLMREWAARPVGTYTGPGGLDGVARVFSYRAVGAYPLVATVGLAVDDILAAARARQRIYVREAARRTLEAHGYRVRLAASGAEGVAAYVTHRDDTAAVLTDMMMPDMDGPATIAALRRIDPALVVIAATGLPEEARVARAIDAGASHVIAKPFSSATLLRTLHAAVAASRA